MLIKIINEETKEVSVFWGSDEAWALQNGFVQGDVEQAYDGNWYLAGFAPAEPIPTTEEVRVQREAYRTQHCDPLTCRKIRKSALGVWTEADETEYVNAMNDIEALINQMYPYPNIVSSVESESSENLAGQSVQENSTQASLKAEVEDAE